MSSMLMMIYKFSKMISVSCTMTLKNSPTFSTLPKPRATCTYLGTSYSSTLLLSVKIYIAFLLLLSQSATTLTA